MSLLSSTTTQACIHHATRMRAVEDSRTARANAETFLREAMGDAASALELTLLGTRTRRIVADSDDDTRFDHDQVWYRFELTSHADHPTRVVLKVTLDEDLPYAARFRFFTHRARPSSSWLVRRVLRPMRKSDVTTAARILSA